MTQTKEEEERELLEIWGDGGTMLFVVCVSLCIPRDG